MPRPKVLSLATVLVSLITSGVAVAQDATTPPPAAPPAADVVVGDQPAATGASDKEKTEEIVVTGTRIRRKDLNTPAPVTVISREAILASGKVNLGDFLQAMPEQGNAVNAQVNNGGSGAVRVDLRGLGNLRTLVLLNGRRMVFSGIGLQTGSGVDLNTIPTAAIERIEVLKDGASAVYGSDAIGGVINVITKKGFSTSELNAYGGVSSRGDGEVYDVNFTTGARGDRGSVLFSAGYSEQRTIWAGDRDFSRYQLERDFATGEVTRVGSSRAPSGRVFDAGRFADPTLPGPDNIPGNGDDVPNPDYQPGNTFWQGLLASGSSFTFDPVGGTAGCDPVTGACGSYRPFVSSEIAPAGDLYNFQPVNYLVTPNKRINLFTIGDARLSDSVRAFFEGSYTNRKSSQQLAPEPLIIGSGGVDVVVSRNNAFNPFGRDFDNLTMRMEAAGPRLQQQDVDTFRVVGGLDGSLPDTLGPLSGWSWDTSLNYGRTVGTWVYRGNLIASRLQNALGPTFVDPGIDPGTADDVLRCGTAASPIANCVPLDLFHGSAAITPDMVNYVSFTGPNRITNALTSFQANLGGDLFQLLADRPVGLAVGYEFRHESGAFVPDPINAGGDGTGGATGETAGSFDVHEGYGELVIPVVSGLPFADDVEASVAARVFDYSTFGSDWTYKLGARWRVIPDVTVRGTYSTAFRAPTITELYLGASENFPSASDPCARNPGDDGIYETPDDILIDTASTLGTNCGAAVNNTDDSTQLRSINAGSADLEPETAKIGTVGVVIQPRWVKNLSVTVDYYRISIKNSITTFGVPYILSQCYSDTAAADPTYCSMITRDASRRITSIDDINVNVGGDKTAGLDFALRYALPTDFGRFGFQFDGTWLQYYDRTIAGGQVIDGRATFDLGNLIGGTGGIYPKFKALTGVTWGMKGLGAGVNLRYIGTITECADADGLNYGGLCSQNPTGLSREVSDYYLWDAFVSYRLKNPLGSTNVAVGMRNVFDQAPPVIYNSFTPTSDPTAYDFVGRFVYATVGHQF